MESHADVLQDPKPKIVVEFFGPSGAGKSTFGDYVLAHPEMSQLFRPWMEACKGRYRKFRRASDGSLDMQRALLARKLQNLASRDLDNEKKRFLADFFRENLLQECRLIESRARGVFLREDGVFHNFGAEILELPPDKVRLLAEGRLFVRFGGNTEVILRRVQEREKLGGHRPQYQDKSVHQVIEVIERSNQRARALDKLLTLLGHQVLLIDVSDSLELSAHRLSRFYLDFFAGRARG